MCDIEYRCQECSKIFKIQVAILKCKSYCPDCNQKKDLKFICYQCKKVKYGNLDLVLQDYPTCLDCYLNILTKKN